MLILYTQDRCNWCDRLKEKLKEWGHTYTEINIKHDQAAKDMMRRNGHSTVPQLYYDGRDMLKGDSTKIRETLGWKSEYTFPELMHEMCDHWMDVLQNKKSLR